jgi:hypothetical protein
VLGVLKLLKYYYAHPKQLDFLKGLLIALSLKESLSILDKNFINKKLKLYSSKRPVALPQLVSTNNYNLFIGLGRINAKCFQILIRVRKLLHHSSHCIIK